MPIAPNPLPSFTQGLPDWLQQVLQQVSVNPMMTAVPAAGVGEPMVKALGKPVSELLGSVFSPGETKTGVPQRLQLTGFKGGRPGVEPTVGLHSGNLDGQPFEATLDQLSQLLDGGALNLQQPPQGAVAKIQRTLSQLLGPAPPTGRPPVD